MSTDEKLREFYYDKNQSHPLWVGDEAINELEAYLKPKKTARNIAKRFLSRQEIFQIHIPPPKKVVHPIYQVYEPNKLGMVDLVEMPKDKLYGVEYSKILFYEDVASGFIQLRALKNKKASSTTFAMKDILKFVSPEEIYSDAGNEFKASFKKLLEEKEIKFKTEVTKYHHGFTGPLDNKVKIIEKLLFKFMDVQELNDDSKVSKIWVKALQKVAEYYNNKVTRRLGMSPSQAMKEKILTPKRPKKFPKEKILPEDGLYRYLLKLGEENKDSRRRATDNYWSRKTFRLDRIIENPGQRVLYYLAEGPERAFVKEELMLIPEDTQAPPDYVQKW